jgi:hypothetical protein
MNSVRLELDPHEAEALDFAAQYLTGFGRVFELLDDHRRGGADLREVVVTLRALHQRATASRAA